MSVRGSRERAVTLRRAHHVPRRHICRFPSGGAGGRRDHRCVCPRRECCSIGRGQLGWSSRFSPDWSLAVRPSLSPDASLSRFLQQLGYAAPSAQAAQEYLATVGSARDAPSPRHDHQQQQQQQQKKQPEGESRVELSREEFLAIASEVVRLSAQDWAPYSVSPISIFGLSLSLIEPWSSIPPPQNRPSHLLDTGVLASLRHVAKAAATAPAFVGVTDRDGAGAVDRDISGVPADLVSFDALVKAAMESAPHALQRTALPCVLSSSPLYPVMPRLGPPRLTAFARACSLLADDPGLAQVRT